MMKQLMCCYWLFACVNVLQATPPDPDEWPSKIVIEKTEGLAPMPPGYDPAQGHYPPGTALKIGAEYSMTVDFLFLKLIQRVGFSMDGQDSYMLINILNHKDSYGIGERQKVIFLFKPKKAGSYCLRFWGAELGENGFHLLRGSRTWKLFPVTIRPAMDLRCMTSLEGISMAAREGWLTLAVGALAFVGLAWRKAPLRKWKGWVWLSGWIGVTFLGQLGVWFLMDKLFLSYPERVFTPFDHFNLPAILSAVITLTAGWFALRRQGGGKADPA